MKINTEKYKVISDSTTNLTIENVEMEILIGFKFLGSLVPNSSDDVKRRIASANSVFGRLKKKCMATQRYLGKVKATSLQCTDTTSCYIWL